MPPPPGITPPASDIVTLSLISHTNAGKTTLARTLLRKDVGEVKDAAHVTLFNESFTLLEEEARLLRLWDTPGFGDSARLLKRLKRERNPVLWFLSQAWDRISDKPLWCSQQALKNVRDEADVVLYLVNATEPPEVAAYIAPEMEILSWVGKPVLVLLNQTGPLSDPETEEAELATWKTHLATWPLVRDVLRMDAFARCWVQEDKLMDCLTPLLSEQKAEPFKHLKKAWRQRNLDVFNQSSRVLSELLTAAVVDGIEVRNETLLERVGFGRTELNREYQESREKLATHLADRMTAATNALIRLHGLEGESARALGALAKEQFHSPQAVPEAIWSVVGSFAGGAMGGLIADLKMGGMTFGGGALVGGLAAGLGAYALILSYNLVRGEDHRLHWSREHFREQVRLAILTYLAVAHFGRGRGEWQESVEPEHWNRVVDEVLQEHLEGVDRLWRDGVQKGVLPSALSKAALPLVTDCLSCTLARLYPDAEIEI
ncbi:50S ribosome-binding GTPase [Prosthecobacter debontii]|uniref:50S ribosome-binding GTPase n=1 Tax=Prosthecobacter debontii TaxID=48467 RepID=A0A1T4YXE9_9BACT|nr:GTPase domain-containing protein [Prosthecobacter debontii]SKB06479.1 50S ribosome-binding GTPase [Prosthecobacter debontii]